MWYQTPDHLPDDFYPEDGECTWLDGEGRDVEYCKKEQEEGSEYCEFHDREVRLSRWY